MDNCCQLMWKTAKFLQGILDIRVFEIRGFLKICGFLIRILAYQPGIFSKLTLSLMQILLNASFHIKKRVWNLRPRTSSISPKCTIIFSPDWFSSNSIERTEGRSTLRTQLLSSNFNFFPLKVYWNIYILDAQPSPLPLLSL